MLGHSFFFFYHNNNKVVYTVLTTVHTYNRLMNSEKIKYKCGRVYSFFFPKIKDDFEISLNRKITRTRNNTLFGVPNTRSNNHYY